MKAGRYTVQVLERGQWQFVCRRPSSIRAHDIADRKHEQDGRAYRVIRGGPCPFSKPHHRKRNPMLGGMPR